MAKAGGDNSTAWPPEGRLLVEALPFVLPEVWAAYSAVGRELARVREAARVGPGIWLASRRRFSADDATSLIRGMERAEAACLAGLRKLAERGLYELWGRPHSPIEPARAVPSVAIEAITSIDVFAGKANGPGLVLVDLRLRQTARPADAAPPSTSAWAFTTARKLLADGVIYEGMSQAQVARALEAEAKKAVKAGVISSAPKATYMENQLRTWGIWPLALLL